jgi:hypothetical protein
MFMLYNHVTISLLPEELKNGKKPHNYYTFYQSPYLFFDEGFYFSMYLFDCCIIILTENITYRSVRHYCMHDRNVICSNLFLSIVYSNVVV